jgi:transposase
LEEMLNKRGCRWNRGRKIAMSTDYVGIDVSSKELSVALKRAGKVQGVQSFSNDGSGHRRLCRYLTKGGRTARVCMESTGMYGLDLALALHSWNGIEVMVANPRSVRRFAEAAMHRSKNDITDAYVILEYAERMPFRSWQPPSDIVFELRAITRRISALKEERAKEKNRLHASGLSKTTPGKILNSIRQTIRFYDRQIDSLSAAALEIIYSDEILKRRFELLKSVTGIAEASATVILGEIAMLPDDIDVRQLVAIAGLDPREIKSGTSVNKRKGISRTGNKNLRTALFMPALVASKYSPNVKAFKEHLLSKKLKKIQAVVAIMRKMLHSIWGMFKHNTTFDQGKFYVMPEK